MDDIGGFPPISSGGPGSYYGASGPSSIKEIRDVILPKWNNMPHTQGGAHFFDTVNGKMDTYSVHDLQQWLQGLGKEDIEGLARGDISQEEIDLIYQTAGFAYGPNMESETPPSSGPASSDAFESMNKQPGGYTQAGDALKGSLAHDYQSGLPGSMDVLKNHLQQYSLSDLQARANAELKNRGQSPSTLKQSDIDNIYHSVGIMTGIPQVSGGGTAPVTPTPVTPTPVTPTPVTPTPVTPPPPSGAKSSDAFDAMNRQPSGYTQAGDALKGSLAHDYQSALPGSLDTFKKALQGYSLSDLQARANAELKNRGQSPSTLKQSDIDNIYKSVGITTGIPQASGGGSVPVTPPSGGGGAAAGSAFDKMNASTLGYSEAGAALKNSLAANYQNGSLADFQAYLKGASTNNLQALANQVLGRTSSVLDQRDINNIYKAAGVSPIPQAVGVTPASSGVPADLNKCLNLQYTNSTEDPSKVYVLVKGINPQTKKNCFIKYEGGQIKYMDLPQNSADCSSKLSDILDANKKFKVPDLESARIYFSIGEPLSLANVTDKKTGLPSCADPNPTDLSDPNADIRYQSIEYSFSSSGVFINQSAVDYASISTTISAKGITQGIETDSPEFLQNVANRLEAAGGNWAKLIQRDASGNIIRILSPKQLLSNPTSGVTYLAPQNAIPALKTYFSSNPIYIKTKEGVVYKGTYSNGTMQFTGSDGSKVSFNMPDKQYAIFGSDQDSFAAPPRSEAQTQLIAQFCTAIEHNVYMFSSQSDPVYTSGDTSKPDFYSNHAGSLYGKNNGGLGPDLQFVDVYAQAVHEFKGNSTGCYAYAYDDKARQDATVNVGTGDTVQLTLR